MCSDSCLRRPVLRAPAVSIVLWVALLLAGSCAPEPEPGPGPDALDVSVAQVGPYEITPADAAEAVAAIFGAAATPATVTKDQLTVALDALIGARVLVLEAERRGLDDDPAVQAVLDSMAQKRLRETIYERDVYAGLPPPTAADIDSLFQAWGSGEQVRAAHILTPDPQEAEQLLARLAQGEDFAQLARAHSQHAASNAQGGTMGYLRRSQYPAAIAEAIWSLPVATVVAEPVRTYMGWHVLKVEGRRRLTLEQQRQALETEFSRRQRLAAERRFQQQLKSTYEVVYHPETAVAVASLLDTLSGDRRLFSWRDGWLDLAGFLKRVQVPDPVSEDTARMRGLAEQLVLDELAAREARARGYGNLVEVVKPLRNKRFQLLGELMFETEAAPEAAESELRAFFAAHRDEFRSHTVVRVREILVDEEALADSLHAVIAAGQDMDGLARRFSVRSDLRKTGGLWEDVRPDDPRSVRIYQRALAQGPGLHPPVKVAGGYSVFDVLDISPGRQLEYSEVEANVRRSFAGYRMEQLIAGLRSRFKDQIRVNQAAIDAL